MENIIIIRVPDPNGNIFPKIVDAVNSGISENSHINNIELIYPGLRINMKTGIVERNGIQIQLNNSEFRMLCHMAQYPGHIFTKDQLYAAIYGELAYNSNSVPSIICRLRNKLGREPQIIKTVGGLGYKFEIPKG